MYDEMVRRLRDYSAARKGEIAELTAEAADAIESMCDMVATAHSELANVILSYEESKPRWIPVTERLPDKFQPVWVACKMDGRENWTFDTVYDPYRKCPWGTYYLLEKGDAVAYAWMDRSAPEPPQEG